MKDVAQAGRFSRKLRYSLMELLMRHGGRLQDRFYLRTIWRLKFGVRLRLDNPASFNEKLQWLKLNDRHDGYSLLVDKLKVKEFVASAAGKEYVVPTLGEWDRAEDIDFEALPERFVLKCNHGSGLVVICRDKASLDRERAIGVLSRQLTQDFSMVWREYPYRNVRRKVFAEELLGGEETVYDYKFFCFSGKACYIQVDIDRFGKHRRNIYTVDWELTDLEIEYPRDTSKPIPRPERLDEMTVLAEKLSSGIPHVRVDLYHVDGRVYFGEMTFFHGGGFERFRPAEWDLRFGSLLVLPRPQLENSNQRQ